MRKFSSTLIVISLISLLFISSIPIQAQTPNSQEIWMGVYLGDMKLGYMSMSSTKTQYNGRDAYRSDVIMRTKMMLLGARIRQDINMVVYTDLEQKPIFEVFEMSSGGQTSRIEAEFKPDVIECKHVSQGVVTPKSIPIPPGTNLTDDSSLYGVGGKKVQVGDKFSANYFNPLTFTIDPLTSEVTHREKLELRGKTYDVFVVKRNSPMEDMTLWVDENGEPIQIIMKVTMIRETKEEAMAGLGEDEAPSSPAGDFAVLTSMKADVDLPLPRRIKSLKLRVTGIPDQKLAVSDVRQKATWIKTSDKPTVDYAIIAVKPDGKKSAKLPLRAVSLKPFLAEAPYIQCNHPDIKKQARLIVGKETNAFKAANKIRAWVQANMRAQADIGIVRSSLDVLNNRVGVCRDYAILYAALARAAGIPTRIVTGLVFTNGSFYYHVWAESYTGVWTPFDATLNTDFVDATHIKMAQGDATSMFEVSKAIGGLKAHIIDYKHLEK